jgi:flagellar hook-associated protein 3 FlgL
MRITDSMIRERILYNMNSARSEVQMAQTQIATGKRVLRPSDDPIAVAKSTNLRALLRDNEQYQRNIDGALGWLETTELAVNNMIEIITEFKEIGVEGASDTEDASERATLAAQVETLIERLIDSANVTYDGRFVFAGTYTLTRPYSLQHSVSGEAVVFTDGQWLELGNPRIVSGSATVTDGGATTFVEGTDYEIDYEAGRIRRLPGGSMNPGTGYVISYDTETTTQVELMVPDTQGNLNREIAEGVYEPVNVGGEEVLNSGVDIFSLLIDVKNSLFRNDGVAVNQALDEIDAAINQISSSLGMIGATRRGFDLAQAKLDTENTNFKALISSLEDADLAEVIVRFQADQTAYEAALAASGTILNTSLLDFLR